MKNVYFLSDAHLGSLAIPHARMHERRLVRFLDSIKDKAAAIYLLGDMFDFWNEYRYVVPKGYTRFLGKLSELTDSGVEIHFFTGNHDLWTYGYLEQECGVKVHKSPMTTEIYDSVFYMAHGDGLGDPDPKYRFLRRVFHSPLCRAGACGSGSTGPSTADSSEPTATSPRIWVKTASISCAMPRTTSPPTRI